MRRPLVFVGVAAVLAGASMTADSQNRPLTGRSQVATRLGIVAASQVLAARAGVQVLERGGNAVDAAIATNAVMGLMEPTSNGIGGDLFALVYDAKTGTLHGLNASGWAPRALTPEYLTAAGVAELPSRGPYTVTVPGVVAGWHSMREKFGRLPMADLLAPAIHYAKDGFPVAEITSGLWARSLELLEAEPNAARTFLIDGRVPAAGAIFRNPDLARSLARIAERGRDGYYKGPTAEAIVAMLKRARQPDGCEGPGGVRGRVGAADFDDLSGLEGERDPAQRSGHRRPHHAQPDGAVPDGRLRLSLAALAAHDDRGQEARLRRSDPVCRRSAVW